MNLHSAPRPFERWAPPTRFATARDLAIFALCLLLIGGFLIQVWGTASRRPELRAAVPEVASTRA
jgi:hypothetical protein